MRFSIGFASALGVFACAGSAEAFEKQHHVGVDLGLTLLDASDAPHFKASGGLGAHYAYGVTDAFNFVAEANASYFSWGGSLGDPKLKHTVPSSLTTLAV